MAADFDYDAFISYSRDTVDRDIAARLQNELQRFTTPWYRPRTRTLRVFRDETNLQAHPICGAPSMTRCHHRGGCCWSPPPVG